MLLQAEDVIVWQGDSITDANRRREEKEANPNGAGLGCGYALQASAVMLAKYPQLGLKFYNRGISGNRVPDMYARWTEDCLNLKPTLISILIGVNDTWHGFTSNQGVSVPKFERVYRQLLQETKEHNPAIKLVLCEPFVLRCGVVQYPWVPEIEARQAIVAQLAKEFNAVLVKFQSVFDVALNEAPAPYWAYDGVHPTIAGHQRMAQAWLQAIGA